MNTEPEQDASAGNPEPVIDNGAEDRPAAVRDQSESLPPGQWRIERLSVTGNLARYERDAIESLFRQHVDAGPVTRSQLINTAFQVYTDMQLVVRLALATDSDGRSGLEVQLERKLSVHEAWLVREHGQADLDSFRVSSGFGIRER